jgi:hypothetical protein
MNQKWSELFLKTMAYLKQNKKKCRFSQYPSHNPSSVISWKLVGATRKLVVVLLDDDKTKDDNSSVSLR